MPFSFDRYQLFKVLLLSSNRLVLINHGHKKINKGDIKDIKAFEYLNW